MHGLQRHPRRPGARGKTRDVSMKGVPGQDVDFQRGGIAVDHVGQWRARPSVPIAHWEAAGEVLRQLL